MAAILANRYNTTLAIPDYVGSFALIAAFGPRGSLLQLLLEPLGVQELPEIYGWSGTILAITLFTYPYLLLSVRAGLQGIDPAMEEAARSLGHSRNSTFSGDSATATPVVNSRGFTDRPVRPPGLWHTFVDAV